MEAVMVEKKMAAIGGMDAVELLARTYGLDWADAYDISENNSLVRIRDKYALLSNDCMEYWLECSIDDWKNGEDLYLVLSNGTYSVRSYSKMDMTANSEALKLTAQEECEFYSILCEFYKYTESAYIF